MHGGAESGKASGTVENSAPDDAVSPGIVDAVDGESTPPVRQGEDASTSGATAGSMSSPVDRVQTGGATSGASSTSGDGGEPREPSPSIAIAATSSEAHGGESENGSGIGPLSETDRKNVDSMNDKAKTSDEETTVPSSDEASDDSGNDKVERAGGQAEVVASADTPKSIVSGAVPDPTAEDHASKPTYYEESKADSEEQVAEEQAPQHSGQLHDPDAPPANGPELNAAPNAGPASETADKSEGGRFAEAGRDNATEPHAGNDNQDPEESAEIEPTEPPTEPPMAPPAETPIGSSHTTGQVPGADHARAAVDSEG